MLCFLLQLIVTVICTDKTTEINFSAIISLMSFVKIKKAGEGDFEEFYKLLRKTQDEGYFLYSPASVATFETDLPKKTILEDIIKKKRILFLGYVSENFAGYLLTNKMNGGVSFAHWLGVDKKFQKMGVATSLLKFWEKEALKEGCHALELFTTKNDVEFYVNRGFTLAGEFPDAWYGVDHFWFYKTLRKSEEKHFLAPYKNKK